MKMALTGLDLKERYFGLVLRTSGREVIGYRLVLVVSDVDVLCVSGILDSLLTS